MERTLAVVNGSQSGPLFQALTRRGYQVVGPTVRDGAIVYDRLESAGELPAGWTDEQAPGRYRLARHADEALFAYAVGPTSLKGHLHPAEVRLLSAERRGAGFQVLDGGDPPERLAFLGVRACDLAAVATLDRVLLGEAVRDPVYAARREPAFVVAVHCTHPAATCFCASLGTGPRARAGFDLALTELLDGGHRFLAEVGSERGAEVLGDLERAPASAAEVEAAEAAVAAAAGRQVRGVDAVRAHDALLAEFEDPRWDEIASRCLACANCTLVCPTCFCTSVEDSSDLSGNRAERWRRWDSCFGLSFSYIHGGSVRASGRSRYRQWITHKLATWVDQFGSPGCVGCGRCITWCPVGIDITEEARALGGEERHGDA